MTIRLEFVWRKNDPKAEADAIAFWKKHGLMDSASTIQERVKEIAVLAYEDDELVAISTIIVRMFDQLRQKFAFVRESVAPDYRRHKVGGDVLIETRNQVENYARMHPEEGLAGLAAVYQVPGVGTYGSGRTSRLSLIGYTSNNEQVRAYWFEHSQVPPNMTPYTP